MRIGIDVGGTNTDAVLLEGAKLVAQAKRPTTADVTSGIFAALKAVLESSPRGASIEAVMLGTTHFTNALLEQQVPFPNGYPPPLPAGHYAVTPIGGLARRTQGGHWRSYLHGARRP